MERVKKTARKLIVAVIGFLVLIIGIILIPLPGPGILISIAGLFILSLEFTWAERHLDRAKTAQKKVVDAARNNRNKNTPAPKS